MIDQLIKTEDEIVANYETIGRTILRSYLDQIKCTDYEYAKHRYDPTDVFASQGCKRFGFEVKVRSKDYDECMIDVSKFNGMVDDLKKRHLTASYFVVFHDDKGYFYKLQTISKHYHLGEKPV